MSSDTPTPVGIAVTVETYAPPPGTSTLSLAYNGPAPQPAWLRISGTTIDVGGGDDPAPAGGLLFQYTSVSEGYEVSSVTITNADGHVFTAPANNGIAEIADTDVQQAPGDNSCTYTINITPTGGGDPLIVDPIIRNDY